MCFRKISLSCDSVGGNMFFQSSQGSVGMCPALFCSGGFPSGCENENSLAEGSHPVVKKRLESQKASFLCTLAVFTSGCFPFRILRRFLLPENLPPAMKTKKRMYNVKKQKKNG